MADTPGHLAAGAVGGATVLVVDVLRASTSIATAIANGCAGIVPAADPADARRRAAAEGDGVLLAGEQGGEQIPGFDLGNSPRDFAADRVGDRTVVFSTSNGTRALLAARGADAVGVAGLVNATAAARWAASRGRDVTIVCAGQHGSPSLEDRVCAGLLVERVLGTAAGATATPAARRAVETAGPYRQDAGRLAADAPWARRLTAAGHGADVAACLAVDTLTVVPVLAHDVDKVVGGPR